MLEMLLDIASLKSIYQNYSFKSTFQYTNSNKNLEKGHHKIMSGIRSTMYEEIPLLVQ